MSECQRKVRFVSKAQARRSSLWAMSTYGGRSTHAYRCSCGGYHIGHASPPRSDSFPCFICHRSVVRELDRFGDPVEWQVDTLAPHLCRG